MKVCTWMVAKWSAIKNLVSTFAGYTLEAWTVFLIESVVHKEYSQSMIINKILVKSTHPFNFFHYGENSIATGFILSVDQFTNFQLSV